MSGSLESRGPVMNNTVGLTKKLDTSWQTHFFSMQAREEAFDVDTMETHERLIPAANMQFIEASCMLIIILSCKVLMNTFTFWAKPKNVRASFLGCFCVSLAVVDFALLIALSVTHYFQDFAIWGIRFTNYHICLFTQIISYVYGILHFPVFFAAGLDYYLMLVKSINPHRILLHLFYITAVLLLWITAFFHVLHSPVNSFEMDHGLPLQCTFYVSSQSYYLSAGILCTIFLVLVFCFFEVVAFIKSIKIISYSNTTVMLFSCGDKWPVQGIKHLLGTFTISFLGTWAPYVLLQMIVLVLCANIPAYMDMNVPWLFYLNSYLLGMAYFFKYPNIQLRDKTFSIDPFISWYYCLLPFITTEQTKEADILNELP